MLNKETPILIISNEPWGDVWFVKHRYAYELARLGYEVFFVDAPGDWKPRDLFSLKSITKQESGGVKVIEYRNNFPIRILPRVFLLFNDLINSFKLRRIVPKKVLFWQFDHRRFINFFFFRALRIYHIADPYYKAPYDRFIVPKAELIICTSPKYLPFYENRHKSVIHVPHVILRDEFEVSEKRVEEIKEMYGPFLIYTGLINSSTDFDLIERLLSKGMNLLFIGPVDLQGGDLDKWRSVVRRINYLGALPAHELKNYIAASLGGLVLYRFDLKGTIRSPLKILGYLAQGKPVITSFDPDISEKASLGIFYAQEPLEFLEIARHCLMGDFNEERALVKEYLEANTYDSAIDQIFKKLAE